MNETEKIYYKTERTEEVQQIIERMPTRFGLWITIIVMSLFSLMFFFGYKIRYPDVVMGQITINTHAAPIKLIANTNGKLHLNGLKSLATVKENDIVAYVQNSADLKDVEYVNSLIKSYNPTEDKIIDLISKLPKNLALGELNSIYYAFVNSLQELANYKHDKLFEKQEESLRKLSLEQEKAIQSSALKVKTGANSLRYMQKFHRRDSVLLSKQIVSEADFDQTEITYLNSKDNYQNAISNLINNRQQAQQTESKIQEISIQKTEKEKELKLAVLSTYTDLQDNIKIWEQKYVFRAPFNGKVQFLKFWTTNQFVQSGEPIFTVIPKNDQAIGQVILPIKGAGKVKKGQEVIVKLEDYPYVEYGSIKGKVQSISLTTNSTKTENGDIETYMIMVDFPQQLKTNYGTVLDFKFEAKGTAEIITNDRRLIQRLFDNLKYIIKK
ncbi:HlyD family efflux transporter periplasmic adaptor subunit [Flavobacterium daejeonense]|uniref:HlyD family efflux transporter periplasmic adaptor subunit n=1 Tax=Flavobacterium daejeonense TaxID=350893 RepID=UPI00047D9CAE|nr:HlyD family efflux transporter periplasmic adaptor subunit [Flavobacterium daejeonense]